MEAAGGRPPGSGRLGLWRDRGAGCHLLLSVRPGVSDLRRKPSLRPFPTGTVSPMAPPVALVLLEASLPLLPRPRPTPSAGAIAAPSTPPGQTLRCTKAFFYTQL